MQNRYMCYICYNQVFNCGMEYSLKYWSTRTSHCPSKEGLDKKSTVRMKHGEAEWFHIGKGVRKDVYCHHTYFTCIQNIQ